MQVKRGAYDKAKTREFTRRLEGGRRLGQGSGGKEKWTGSRKGGEIHEQSRGLSSVKGILWKIRSQLEELPIWGH